MFDTINAIVTRAYLAAKRDEGQTFVEYSLIAAFVGLALIVGLGIFATDVTNALKDIGTKL
ncbi:MAG: Flp family type IVb pilin [Gaiellaceae bacterium]